LFDAAVETMRPDLAVPSQLYSPRYRCASHHHRAYQTLLPLSLRLKLTINNTCFPTDEGAELARCVVDNDDGVSLVCWDHKNIPDIADAIPRASDSVIPPPTWPDDVFDIIWAFTQSSTEPGKYNFTRLNQCLLQGDTA
jgi:hypothetical protein